MAAPFAALESRVNDAVVARLANATASFAAPTGDVDGIFDAEYLAPFDAISSAAPSFQCRAADVAAIAYGASCTVNSIAYKVVKLAPDGSGMTRLKLERQA